MLDIPVRDFDGIKDIQEKTINGATLRPVFTLKATIEANANGYSLHYQDVDIRSQSYIRTHQKNGYGPRAAPGDHEREGPDVTETKGHESRQREIDKGLYEQMNNTGAFKRAVEDGKSYGSRAAAEAGRQKIESALREKFENDRNALGRQLQIKDGKYHW